MVEMDRRTLFEGLKAMKAGVKFNDLPPNQQLAVFQEQQAVLWETKIKPRRDRRAAYRELGLDK